MAAHPFYWDTLSAEEVSARLQQLENEGREPVSDFLDIHQWLPLSGQQNYCIGGGFQESQFRRVALGTSPPGLEIRNVVLESLPDNARTARGARAFLQHAAGAGSIGDISLGPHVSVVSLPGALAAIDGIASQPTTSWSPPILQPRRITAASNRADAVVAAAFNISREEAQTALKYSFVYVDFKPLTRRTASIKSGDSIIFRARGRVEIHELGISSKSGRCWLEVTANLA